MKETSPLRRTYTHAAIRAARKAYQVDGTMPDWEALEELIDRVGRAE